MASSSSSASPSLNTSSFILPNCTQILAVKLEGRNYPQWLSIFEPILRSNEMEGFVDGTKSCPQKFLTNEQSQSILNPKYSLWIKKDQHLLSWINATLSEKVLSTIYGLKTSRQVWVALATRFASQSHSHISHIKKQLLNMRQGSQSCSEYLQSVKNWFDQPAVIGKPLDDKDLMSFIVSDLDPKFNSFVTSFSFTTQEKSLTLKIFRMSY
jgi:hypothetical protein